MNLAEALAEAGSGSKEAAKVANYLAGSSYGVASSFLKGDEGDDALLGSDKDEARRLAIALGQDPGDKKDANAEGGLNYGISVTAKPFVVDNRLNLLEGWISITGSIEKELGEIKEKYKIPPIGTLLQFEVEAKLGLSLKVELTTGLKVVNRDLVPSNDVLKVTATGGMSDACE